MLENDLRQAIASLEKMVFSRLKYNIFTSEHPKKSLAGKLFKFIGGGKIQMLTSKRTVSVSKEDLHSGGKKLYFPADMGR